MTMLVETEPDLVPAAADPSRLGIGTGLIATLRCWQRRRNPIVAAVVILLALLIAFWPEFEGPASQMDEGMLLVYPEQLLHGKFPYRDFETFYGPASPGFLAAAYAVAGTTIFVERSVGLLYRVVILVAVFAIGRRWGTRAASGGMLISGLLLVPTHLMACAWLGAMACALWSLWLAGKLESGRRCFGSGLLAGLALMFRLDIGPAIILSALPLLWGMKWSERWKYFAGGAVGLLPLVASTAIAGYRPVLDNLFLLPVFSTSAGRRLPLFAAEPCLVSLFFVHLFATLVNIIAGISALVAKPRDIRGRLLLAVAIFGLGLTHQAAQRLDLTHLLFVAFISFAILPVSLVILGSRIRRLPTSQPVMIWASIAVLALIEAVAPELTVKVRDAFAGGLSGEPVASFIDFEGRPFPFRTARNARTVAKVLETLSAQAKPGERLFVGPGDLRRTNYSDTYLYHLLPKLTPATYFLEMNPLSANRPGSRLAADVASADWLILNRAWDQWNEPNRSMEFASTTPNEVVQKDFQLVQGFGSYFLYRRVVRVAPVVARQ